jgi:predicted CopG family antitoxin
MRTLNVSISDLEYSKFGIKNDKLSFTDFIEIVSKELTRQNLSKCIELASKYGLSKLSMEEITNEVKAVRQDAKNRN